MKLSQVTITHFRCFEHLTIELAPVTTLIVGANGSGKTSILDAIAISLFEVVSYALSKGGEPARKKQGTSLQPTDIFTPPGSGETLTRRKQFVQVRALATDLYPTDTFGLFARDEGSLKIDWETHITYRPPNQFRYSPVESRGLAPLLQYLASLWDTFRQVPGAATPIPAIAYYRSSRRFKGGEMLGGLFDTSFERSAAYEDALDAGSDYGTMCKWLYLVENEELRGGKRSTHSTVLRAMRAALRELLPDIDEVGFRDLPPQLSVRHGRGRQRSWQTVSQLSDGYRGLISVCLDFARRLALANPYSEAPLNEPGILLIDELELHLHPGWQQTIIPNLQRMFKGTQIIATTHSPQVLTTVKKDQIRILNAERSFERISDDVGTYGVESTRTLERILGVQPRPHAGIESVPLLSEYLSLVEAGEGGSARAMNLRQDLERAFGTSDPALQLASMRIRQLEILKRR